MTVQDSPLARTFLGRQPSVTTQKTPTEGDGYLIPATAIDAGEPDRGVCRQGRDAALWVWRRANPTHREEREVSRALPGGGDGPRGATRYVDCNRDFPQPRRYNSVLNSQKQCAAEPLRVSDSRSSNPPVYFCRQ